MPASSGDPAIYSDYQFPNELEPGLNEAALTRLMGFGNLNLEEGIDSDDDILENVEENNDDILKNDFILNQKLEIQVIIILHSLNIKCREFAKN